MRLSVFIPEVNPQLLIDLKKLYLDVFPDHELSDENIKSNLIENPLKKLFVTKFNDRHLGAVSVESSAGKATLSDLCIREVTRRRGIAKNLLREVEKHLAELQVEAVEMSLAPFSESEKQGVTAFMLASDYQLKGELFVKQL